MAVKRGVNEIADALFGLIGTSIFDHRALAADTEAQRWVKPSDYLHIYKDVRAGVGSLVDRRHHRFAARLRTGE